MARHETLCITPAPSRSHRIPPSQPRSQRIRVELEQRVADIQKQLVHEIFRECHSQQALQYAPTARTDTPDASAAAHEEATDALEVIDDGVGQALEQLESEEPSGTPIPMTRVVHRQKPPPRVHLLDGLLGAPILPPDLRSPTHSLGKAEELEGGAMSVPDDEVRGSVAQVAAATSVSRLAPPNTYHTHHTDTHQTSHVPPPPAVLT